MRVELTIPDSTNENLKAHIIALAERINREPEVAADIELEEFQPDEHARIQAMFTPERLAHIAKSDAEIDAGHFYTRDQVDEHFRKKSDAWKLKNL